MRLVFIGPCADHHASDDNDSGVDLRQKAQQASSAKQSIRISAKQLTRFFDGSLWNDDFGDSSNSFYGIYRTLFETINQSEVYATAPAGEPALSPVIHYPTFGNSTTSYDASDGELKRFYSAFLSFASRRPFNEADKYRLQDAPDRQVRRLMERENKKARDDARKEYNEAVRSLAAFLKKRDPRFLNSASSDPIKLKQLEKRRLEAQLREAALDAARKREEAARAFVEQDWMKVHTSATVEDDFEESADEDNANGQGSDNQGTDSIVDQDQHDGDFDDDPVEDWYCAACDKLFNSQGAWDNHERSRKHLQNMKRLKKEMLAEEDHMTTSQELGDSGNVSTAPPSDPELDDLEREFRKLSKKERKRFGLRQQGPPESEKSNLFQNMSDNTTEAEEGLSHDADVEEQNFDVVSPTIETPESQTPQISKRDKRRAREAAKKAAQGDQPPEEVSCRPWDPVCLLICGGHARFAESAMQRLHRERNYFRISRKLGMPLPRAIRHLISVQLRKGVKRASGNDA